MKTTLVKSYFSKITGLCSTVVLKYVNTAGILLKNEKTPLGG